MAMAIQAARGLMVLIWVVADLGKRVDSGGWQIGRNLPCCQPFLN
jgi:hypothetical protein